VKRRRQRWWSGTTLIETIVALALLAGLLLLWQPLLRAVATPRWADQDLQAVIGFQHALQQQIPPEATVSVVSGRLRVHPPSGDETDFYLAGGTTTVRKVVVAKGGYQPMLDDVTKLTWRPVGHAVAFSVVMGSKRVYEGVVRDGETNR
jgi:competence protein ComGF